MEAEVEYLRASASTSQQVTTDCGDFSNMAYYRSDSASMDGKYQDFSSTWTSPYIGESQKCMSWPAAFCDGETTDPASDDLEGSCQIPSASSSSSDEGSERQARGILPQQRRGLAAQGSSQNARAAQQPPAARQLPECYEEGLIDIDPEEGRRRGDELWAMLFSQETTEVPLASTFSTLSVNAPAFNPPKPAGPQQLHQEQQPRQLRQSQLQSQCWETAWEGCGTRGWVSEASEETSPTAVGTARHAAAVQQAAHEAFGSLLKEVVVANDGYLIQLHSSFRQYEEVPVLTILSRALWPLLGREVVTLEPSVAPAGQHRLVLQCSEGESQSCWEFATTGSCPRGSRCRWEHVCTAPAMSTSYIDVVY